MFVVGGESLVDLKSEPMQADGVVRMAAYAGGSPMNCAIAISKLGGDAGFLCPISRDAFGDYILAPLNAAGVKVLLSERVADYTTLAVVSDDGKGNPRYAFYRHADRAFTRDSLIGALPAHPTLFQIGGFCPIEPEDAEVWMDVAKTAADRGAVISIDPNVRPTLIADMQSYKQRLSRFLDLAHIIKISHEDLGYVAPPRTLDEHAATLLKRPNCKLVVITLGEGGSMALTTTGKVSSPIYPATPGGDNVGAGDTLMAGMLTWLEDHQALTPAALASLNDDQLTQMLWFGAVAAGINCSRVGANPPTRDEVEAVLRS